MTTDVPLLSTAVTTRWRYASTPVDAPPDPSAITVVADELLLRVLPLRLLLGLLLWPWHSAVHYELLLLLLSGPWHISACPPAEATWIANDVGMGVCVVVVVDSHIQRTVLATVETTVTQ